MCSCERVICLCRFSDGAHRGLAEVSRYCTRFDRREASQITNVNWTGVSNVLKNSEVYVFGATFALVALYFNPVLPITLSRSVALPLVILCALAFLGSVRYLGPVPKMSLATITDLPARGESL